MKVIDVIEPKKHIIHKTKSYFIQNKLKVTIIFVTLAVKTKSQVNYSKTTINIKLTTTS